MDAGVANWLIRLLVAAALSGVIGFEREIHDKAAGLRTHMLVGLGAALFTLASIDGFQNADPARVAAQVVTGVGFLGAGAIFREGASVRGLTTAAGLWAVAAIGLTSGAGLVDGAVAATVIAVVVLYGLRKVELLIRRREGEGLVKIVVTLTGLSDLPRIIEMAHRIDDAAKGVRLKPRPDGTTTLRMAVRPDRTEVMRIAIGACDGVAGVDVQA